MVFFDGWLLPNHLFDYLQAVSLALDTVIKEHHQRRPSISLLRLQRLKRFGSL